MKNNIIILAFLILCSAGVGAERRTVHVLVALCDNVNQGIVKVPAKIGNGQDPANNLYWGCGYGVKGFFKKSEAWSLMKIIKNPAAGIHERLLFKHKNSDTWLLADAYDGAKIKSAIQVFLRYTSGANPLELDYDSIKLSFGGGSNLLSYIGHNGLMEFNADVELKPVNTQKRETIILSCISKTYFSELIKQSGAYPLLWTNTLMCPEAYTLEAALDAWIKKKSNKEIHKNAAAAYSKYQKCSRGAAEYLLTTGW